MNKIIYSLEQITAETKNQVFAVKWLSKIKVPGRELSKMHYGR